MKQKLFALLLCMVFICTLSLPVYADAATTDSDGYSVLISDIPTVCPTCGAALHASWASTSGAEVEVQISAAGSIKIPAGAGSFAHIKLRCELCGYEKSETRLLGLDFGHENPGNLHVEKAPSGIGRKDLPGYADDKGSALVDKDGWPTATYTMLLDGYDTSVGIDTVYKHSNSNNGSWYQQSSGSFSVSSGNLFAYGIYDSVLGRQENLSVSVSYYYIAPVSGYYTLSDTNFDVSFSVRDSAGKYIFGDKGDCHFLGYVSFGQGISKPTNRYSYWYPKTDLSAWHITPLNINAYFLNTLMCCRHYHISFYGSAQRFQHVDKMLRDVTMHVIQCRKIWRFQLNSYYDGYMLENAQDPSLVRPIRRTCWFVTDADYNAYDTLQVVDNLQKSFDENDMLTEAEILANQAAPAPVGMDVVTPSRKGRKIQRDKAKR